MKKLVIFVFLIISVSSFSTGFREVRWGEGLKKIRSAEKKHKLVHEIRHKEYEVGNRMYEWDKDLYTFEETLNPMGIFKVSYVLVGDKLIQGIYAQGVKNSDLKNYNTMKKLLKEKYGEPVGNYNRSSFGSVSGKTNREFKNVVTWVTEDTRIDLIRAGKNRYEVSYSTLNKKLIEFVKDKKEILNKI